MPPSVLLKKHKFELPSESEWKIIGVRCEEATLNGKSIFAMERRDKKKKEKKKNQRQRKVVASKIDLC